MTLIEPSATADVIMCITDDVVDDYSARDDAIASSALRPNAAIVLHEATERARFYRSIVRLEADVREDLSTSTLLDTIRHGR